MALARCVDKLLRREHMEKRRIMLYDRKYSILLDFLSIGKFFREDNILITSYDKIAMFVKKAALLTKCNISTKTSVLHLESIFPTNLL